MWSKYSNLLETRFDEMSVFVQGPQNDITKIKFKTQLTSQLRNGGGCQLNCRATLLPRTDGSKGFLLVGRSREEVRTLIVLMMSMITSRENFGSPQSPQRPYPASDAMIIRRESGPAFPARHSIDPLSSLCKQESIDTYLSAAVLAHPTSTEPNRTPPLDLKPAALLKQGLLPSMRSAKETAFLRSVAQQKGIYRKHQ